MDEPGVGVGVMLLNKKGEVLLGRRNDDPAKADSELHGEGTWTMPGGKVHFGELLVEAAARELREETGITGDSFELLSVTDDMVPGKHFVTIGFLCMDFGGEPRAMEPEEITEWRWFPLDAMPEKIFPPSAKMLKNYISGDVMG